MELGKQSGEANTLISNIRLLLLATWGLYPITYMLPMFGIAGESAAVGIRIGYAVSDALAKAACGVMIHAIARAKLEEDGTLPDLQNA